MGSKGDTALRMGEGRNGCMVGWHVRMDLPTDSPCVLQDFVPFVVAAQKAGKFGAHDHGAREKEITAFYFRS